MNIQSWLEQLGMDYEKFEVSEHVYWGVNIESPLFTDTGEGQLFNLFISQLKDRFNDGYVRLTIAPYIERPYKSVLAEVVSQINHELFLARFAFDGDGDLELVCDIVESRLTFDDFKTTLETLGAYAGFYYNELLPYKK